MRTLILLGASLTLANTALAAEPSIRLELMAGKVLLQSATGLTAVKNGSVLQPGDTLMLKNGSAAILNAAESGCFVSLRQPGVYVVPSLTDCTPGQAVVLKSSAIIEPANGYPDGGGYPDMGYPDAGVLPPPPPEPPISGFLMGTGFAAAVAAVVVYNTVIDDEKPPTPVSSH
jgi:hypothetical protein